MKVGIVGWRGMVGSVLMDRMSAERDFDLIDTVFFSTSNAGGAAPSVPRAQGTLKNADDIAALSALDAVITCQGSDYTKEIYPKLRATGWNGYWIDAAKSLRMQDDAVIILDPVNRPVIDSALARGIKNYIGGNCTVSCMLMGVGRPVQAGSRRVDDLHHLSGSVRRRRAAHARAADPVRHVECRGASELLADPASAILEIDRRISGKPARARRRRDAALHRAAGRQPDPVDRRRSRRRHQPAKSGRAAPRSTRSLAAGPGSALPQRRSIRSACASARCAATRSH